MASVSMPSTLAPLASALPDSTFDSILQKRDILHVVDGRTGTYHALPIHNNAIDASEFRKIKSPADTERPADQNELGLRINDPGFANTTIGGSEITYM
jgi:DNA-binding cell septation regulator SpoVG